MPRKLQLLAIITSILVVIFAYLYHVPNSEGVPQMDRIRLLSASMKIISFVVSRIVLSCYLLLVIFSFYHVVSVC